MEEQIEEGLVEENLEEKSFSPYFYPRIFEGSAQEEVPPDFNAVTIQLDGRLQADLNWKKARQQALIAVEKGYALMWDMQLGLFTELIQPLTHQAQFLSLTLSLEHFLDSLWKEFKSHTIGISLFRGSADFSQYFPWDEHQKQNLKGWLQEIGGFDEKACDLSLLKQNLEGQQLIRLFCRDVAIEYLALLVTRIPDALSAYLYLDATSVASSHVSTLQLLNPERFDRLHLAIKGQKLPLEVLGWGVSMSRGYSGHSSVELYSLPPIFTGVCIPPMNFYQARHYEGLEEGLQLLQKHSIPFKLISENHLTSQWDGLDYLLYSPNGLSMQGKRKLQGFCAAGGTVVSTGALLGFAYEINLSDWLLSL